MSDNLNQLVSELNRIEKLMQIESDSIMARHNAKIESDNREAIMRENAVIDYLSDFSNKITVIQPKMTRKMRKALSAGLYTGFSNNGLVSI